MNFQLKIIIIPGQEQNAVAKILVFKSSAASKASKASTASTA